jgi:hypothetical protein
VILSNGSERPSDHLFFAIQIMGWGQMPENSKMGLLLSKAKRTYKDATTKGLV